MSGLSPEIIPDQIGLVQDRKTMSGHTIIQFWIGGVPLEISAPTNAWRKVLSSIPDVLKEKGKMISCLRFYLDALRFDGPPAPLILVHFHGIMSFWGVLSIRSNTSSRRRSASSSRSAMPSPDPLSALKQHPEVARQIGVVIADYAILEICHVHCVRGNISKRIPWKASSSFIGSYQSKQSTTCFR